MGMYTELIFGAKLKRETPIFVIDTLKYMIGDLNEIPKEYPFPKEGRFDILFRSSSFYFGVSESFSKMIYNNDYGYWIISTRSSIKNYDGEIETFLEWIKPYIEKGSGYNSFYAIVTYEESDKPKIYYLYDQKMGDL